MRRRPGPRFGREGVGGLVAEPELYGPHGQRGGDRYGGRHGRYGCGGTIGRSRSELVEGSLNCEMRLYEMCAQIHFKKNVELGERCEVSQ